ncbi:MAG TPA: helix-turn-helix transcriptional regulator [Ramlibacter sp.]|nr:helix-turn-helix transcriptional regulator [Ramlibacter sp.]
MGASDFRYIRFERELSPREGQVLQLLAGGASNKLIARALHLSVHTVKRHVARTMLKLHVSSRAEAALLYRSLAGALPRAAASDGAGSVDELTGRERDVLSFVALGASNIEIAERLALSLNTVKRHTANIREKLGVHSRFHAAALLHDAPQRATAASPLPG